MGTYYVPRNYKGESRILYIFTAKSLITTGVGALIGSIFFFIFGMVLGYTTAGLIIMGVFGVLGWAYGALKIPTVAGIAVTKKVGGESLDEIINRYIKFKAKRHIYAYVDTKEDEEIEDEDTKEEN